LPLDPPAASEATVGAVVALGASGPLCCGFGAARDHLLGLTAVSADGRVLTFGGKVLKNVAGYDMTRLLTGSRGSLGLITRVDLRLRPLPEAELTIALHCDGLESIATLAAQVARRAEAVAVEALSAALSVAAVGGAASW